VERVKEKFDRIESSQMGNEQACQKRAAKEWLQERISTGNNGGNGHPGDASITVSATEIYQLHRTVARLPAIYPDRAWHCNKEKCQRVSF